MTKRVFVTLLTFCLALLLLLCPGCRKKDDSIRIGFFGPITGQKIVDKKGVAGLMEQISSSGSALGFTADHLPRGMGRQGRPTNMGNRSLYQRHRGVRSRRPRAILVASPPLEA